jgi:hypothetical protein
MHSFAISESYFNASLLANASLEVSCNASGGTSALTELNVADVSTSSQQLRLRSI